MSLLNSYHVFLRSGGVEKCVSTFLLGAFIGGVTVTPTLMVKLPFNITDLVVIRLGRFDTTFNTIFDFFPKKIQSPSFSQ